MHVIVDNYATHKHPKVKLWRAKHSRVHMGFTPTSASWVNLAERFFRDITDKQIRRVDELKEANLCYLDDRSGIIGQLRQKNSGDSCQS